jgi:hypothetical protein
LVTDLYWDDQSARGAVVGYLLEKKKGRRIYADLDSCSDSYVVQGTRDDYGGHSFTSEKDYKEYARKIAIPKFVRQAQIAEKIKAEMIQLGGMKAEVEMIFSVDPYLGQLPVLKQVELAQWLIDQLIPEVRRHFNGFIWVASAANYDSGDRSFPVAGLNSSFGPHWELLNFARADHVSFTLTITCDYAHAQRYLDIQFEAINEIVARDKVTWSIIPSIVNYQFGSLFNASCADDFDSREMEINELLRSQLESASTEAYFLPIPQPPRSWTKAQEGYSPTLSDAGRGNWRLLSLDANEISEPVRLFWMEYALSKLATD